MNNLNKTLSSVFINNYTLVKGRINNDNNNINIRKVWILIGFRETNVTEPYSLLNCTVSHLILS